MGGFHDVIGQAPSSSTNALMPGLLREYVTTSVSVIEAIEATRPSV